MTSPTDVKLRWKLAPRERGVSTVRAGPRASWLCDQHGKRYARVGYLFKHDAWFWVAGWDSDIPYMNTANNVSGSAADAKAAALAYVKSQLSRGGT